MISVLLWYSSYRWALGQLGGGGVGGGSFLMIYMYIVVVQLIDHSEECYGEALEEHHHINSDPDQGGRILFCYILTWQVQTKIYTSISYVLIVYP